MDFDFFSSVPLDHGHLAGRFPFLQGAILRQKAGDTATFVVGRGRDAVAISFFGALGFGRVGEPVRFGDNGLFAAGLIDLAAQKVRVIQQRAEAKDYLDIHKLLAEGVSLETALGAAQALYPDFNPAVSLKALSYYGDVSRLPPNIQRDLRDAATRVRDIARLQIRDKSLLPGTGSIAHNLDAPASLERSRTRERKDPELEI